jgi:2-keto-3-deoxy-L-rhamnonate aldolase RhmA
MHPNHTKNKLQRGEPVYGHGIRFFVGPEHAKFAKNAGFDFLFIDAEHGSFTLQDGTALCRAALDVGVTPIVRVCGFDHHLCTQYLDNGAQGIIFPHVETLEQVKLIERELFFPPRGSRSLPGPMAINDFLPIAHTELGKQGNETTLAVGMIESPEGVERLDDLLALGVLDAVIVGANDLSMTLGVPAQWESAQFVDAMNSIVASCKKAGVASGLGGVSVNEVLGHWVSQGMTMMYCLSDGQVLTQFPVARLKEIKQAVASASGKA